MLELAVLGLLKERPMHGYELRQLLAQKLGFFWTVSFGSLYPTLKKLERRGLVVQRATTDPSARRRQVYAITATGEQEFLQRLAEGAGSVWEEEKFPLRLAFFAYLRPETRIRLLERRKVYLEDKLEVGRSSLRRAEDRRSSCDGYTAALVRHGMDTTLRDIGWLEGLIAAERRLLDPELVEASATDPPSDLPHSPTPTPSPEPPVPAPEELQPR